MPKPIIYKTDQDKKLITNADQLIQLIRFISKLPEMGAETTRIKMGFQEYFQAFVNKHITDPKLREQLRKIPVEIKPELESEKGPKWAMALYHAAIIKHLLNKLIEERAEQFFEAEKMKEIEGKVEDLIKKSRVEQEEWQSVEEYIRHLAEQEHEIEMLAILALSASQTEMENKIKQLEIEQDEIFKKLYDAFHEDLKGHEVFNNLKDIHGNDVVLDEHEKRQIIESVVKDYTNDFINYCISNIALPFNAQPQAPAAHSPHMLNAYQQQNSGLFEQFQREEPERLQHKFVARLRNKNVHIQHSASGVQAFANQAHQKVETQKENIKNAARVQMEVGKNKMSVEEIKAILARKVAQPNLRA